MKTAVVVGTGLIGTSVAMALTARGVDVRLQDADRRSAEYAVALGAGSLEQLGEPADLLVLAVPPDAVAPVLRSAQNERLARSYTDVASIKGAPQAEVDALAPDPASFVGGHPLSGRERSGPGAARGDLFAGRPWVLTPTAATPGEHLATASELVELCGAERVLMTPDEHDRAVALVSHAPQVAASLLAARLLEADATAVSLAGQGVRDTTRIAGSQADLWTAVLAGNAANVVAVLRALRSDLDEVVDALDGVAGAPDAGRRRLAAALVRGNEGRARLPGKHGTAPVPYAVVPVVVPDRPGELARLFLAAGDAGVNIEDVTIEHSPGRPVGLLELAVQPDRADLLTAALVAAGWTVQR